jgi:undecaprenyl diphosphate synthase
VTISQEPTRAGAADHQSGDPSVPRHVAIIMDGNGRWAEARHQPRVSGHRAGTTNVRSIIKYLGEQGVRFVTIFAFSTENWSRPPEEVSALLGLLREVIESETEELHRHQVRILHLGRLDRLAPALQEQIRKGVETTSANTGLTLSVAFDYGGRAEIVEATRRIVKAGIPAEQIDEQLFARYLFSPCVPDADLVIRTGGEFRISNFLLWQAAYSEFYSTPVNWPDFGEAEAARALEAYRQRHRRFGNVG